MDAWGADEGVKESLERLRAISSRDAFPLWAASGEFHLDLVPDLFPRAGRGHIRDRLRLIDAGQDRVPLMSQDLRSSMVRLHRDSLPLVEDGDLEFVPLIRAVRGPVTIAVHNPIPPHIGVGWWRAGDPSGIGGLDRPVPARPLHAELSVGWLASLGWDRPRSRRGRTRPHWPRQKASGRPSTHTTARPPRS